MTTKRTPTDGEFIGAEQAAAALGVTRATLYAYVSRGKLGAAADASGRASRYRRSDVERLAASRGRARRPREVARATLDWGLPVLESQLTLIENEQLYYRGQPVASLASTATAESIACLLWQCNGADAFPAEAPTVSARALRDGAALRGLPVPERLLVSFTRLQADRPTSGAHADARVVARHAGALLRLAAAAALGGAPSAAPLHAQFGQAWRPTARDADAVRAALAWSADHELNASGFTARCVASTGAPLAKAVIAGMAALSGGRHGGMTARVEALCDELARAPSTLAGLRNCLARGDRLAGFGHPLYPAGDPRARDILARLPAGQVKRQMQRIAAQVEELTGERPSLDYGLVALRRAIGAPEGGAYAMFAVARTIGWIAHALEQRATATLIRPRAAYVGEPPQRPADELSVAAARASIFPR